MDYLMVKMPQFKEDERRQFVLHFGNYSGWNSFMHLSSFEDPVDLPRFLDPCTKQIPQHVANSHPENAKIKWMKLYRFEKKEIYD